MKKIIPLLLAVAMIASLAACGGIGPSTSSTPSTPSTPVEPSTPSTPAEPSTITIGLPQHANVADYYDNDFTRWMETRNNVKLEFEIFSSTEADYKAQLSAMVSANEKLPDILYDFNLNSTEYYTYGLDGYFVDMSQYWADTTLTSDYRARMTDLFDADEFDTVMRKITSPDGGIYPFPSYVVSNSDMADLHMYINQTWLDKLNLKSPTNWDEMVTVLRAFKSGDPNGNGKADELPIVGRNSDAGSGNLTRWLMSNFEYVCDDFYFNVEDGKVFLPYTTDAYREGLKAINALVDEGLAPEISWTMKDKTELAAIWCPADNVALAGMVCAHITQTTTDHPLMLDYQPVAPFNYAILNGTNPITRTFITADAEDPKACFELLLSMCDDDGWMSGRYGVEGRDWHWTKGSDGEDGYEILDSSASGAGTKAMWGCVPRAALWRTDNATKRHSVITAAPENYTWINRRALKLADHTALYLKAAAANNPDELFGRNPAYNDAELELIGSSDSDLKTYIKQAQAEFCVGTLDPNSDADWNNYLKTFESLGAANWIKAAQSAYDRYMAN